MQTRIIDHSEAEAFDQFVANSAYGDMLQTYSWEKLKNRTGTAAGRCRRRSAARSVQ